MRNDLLNKMPRVSGLNRLEQQDAFNSDIINTIHKNLPTAVDQVKNIASRFKGNSRIATAQKIWDFLKTQIKYQKDPAGVQLVRLPNRFLKDGTGDCKSYSLFTGAVLSALGIPFSFRYTSYVPGSTIPTHIYVVTKNEAGQELIIDAVYSKFNAEKPFQYKKDVPMNVYTLSGVSSDSIHMADVISEVISGFTPDEIQAASRGIDILQNKGGVYGPDDVADIGSLKSIVKKVADKVKAAPKAVVTAVKNVAKAGAKVVAAAPRNAFLLLVRLNVRNMAKALYSRKNDNKLKNAWENLGGDFSALIKAAEEGSKKKPILGNDEIGEPATVSAALASAASIIAALAPFLTVLTDKKAAPAAAAPGANASTANAAMPVPATSKNKLVNLFQSASNLVSKAQPLLQKAQEAKAALTPATGVNPNWQKAAEQVNTAVKKVKSKKSFLPEIPSNFQPSYSASSSPSPSFPAPQNTSFETAAAPTQEASSVLPASSGMPSWLLPVGIGAAALLLFMKK